MKKSFAYMFSLLAALAVSVGSPPEAQAQTIEVVPGTDAAIAATLTSIESIALAYKLGHIDAIGAYQAVLWEMTLLADSQIALSAQQWARLNAALKDIATRLISSGELFLGGILKSMTLPSLMIHINLPSNTYGYGQRYDSDRADASSGNTPIFTGEDEGDGTAMIDEPANDEPANNDPTEKDPPPDGDGGGGEEIDVEPGESDFEWKKCDDCDSGITDASEGWTRVLLTEAQIATATYTHDPALSVGWHALMVNGQLTNIRFNF